MTDGTLAMHRNGNKGNNLITAYIIDRIFQNAL
jgi:hypothetical protein